MDKLKRVHIQIFGKVQGVFYRNSAKDKADEIGVYGWIHNTADGSVEAVVQGNKKRVDEFINWCKQGPLIAEVVKVKVVEQKGLENFAEFSIN